MPYIIKISTIFALITNLMIFNAFGQNIQKYHDKVFDDNIKTARIHKKDWELSYPFYELNSNSKLILTFDDLQENPRDFKYTIIHCNQDWTKSNLFFSDYMDGFEMNPIDNYEMSINTMIPYTHYNLEIPNDDINFRKSGNYAIVIYDSSEPDKPVLVKSFMVVEHNVKINAEVKQPVTSLYHSLGHDIKFNLNIKNMDLNNIMEKTDVVIVQNYQWETAISNLDPDFVNNDKIVFNRDDQAVFKAINEYRMFNTRELVYTDKEIADIQYKAPDYFVKLYPDKSRQFMQYFDQPDFNGRYAISNREGWESVTDADYTRVDFTLPVNTNLTPDKVYLYGELTNWAFDDNSQMNFNPDKMQYEKTLLLKQGVYNYRYILKEDAGGDFNHMRFEGSHWETENDYMIIVYFHDRRLGADRIIGFDIVNSVNK